MKSRVSTPLSRLASAALATLSATLPSTAADAPAKPASAPLYERTAMPATPGLVKRPHVNIRGQSTLNSEIVGHLEKDDAVTLLELITLKKPKADEPTNWFRIALPTNSAVWVHSLYVDTNAWTVKATRLNLRGGPGENYSILGRIPKGTPVRSLRQREDWFQIESPTNAYGFVAADYVSKQDAPPAEVVVAPPPADPPLAPPVLPPPPVVPPPADPPITPPPPVAPPAIVDETVVPRFVTREGIVRYTLNIQAPSAYVLESLDTQREVNYLLTSETNYVFLKPLKNRRVILTGEEAIDRRWPNTPVLTIQKAEEVQP